ncbi:MAG: hypothetical protein ACTHXA_13970 [Gulosibacter sp.]|uniref:hypothetical protein n=1 Tax=Gulosibacter sp. TaxID=2817531 RepID=UPI003F901B1E
MRRAVVVIRVLIAAAVLAVLGWLPTTAATAAIDTDQDPSDEAICAAMLSTLGPDAQDKVDDLGLTLSIPSYPSSDFAFLGGTHCEWMDPSGGAVMHLVASNISLAMVTTASAALDDYFSMSPGSLDEDWIMGTAHFEERGAIRDGWFYKTYLQFASLDFEFTAVDTDALHVAVTDLYEDAQDNVTEADATTDADETNTGPRWAYGEELTCDGLLDEATLESLAQSGYVPIERPADDPFLALGGLSCMWGVPQSDASVSVGYAQVTEEQAQAEIDELLTQGYTSVVVDEPAGETTRVDVDMSDPMWAGAPVTFDFRHEFTATGEWFYVSDTPMMDELRANVAAYDASQVLAETEEVALSEDEDEAFTADEPSVLSSLRTIDDLNFTAATATATVAGIGVFVVLLGLPAKLIESAIGNNYERLRSGTLARFAPARMLDSLGKRLARIPRWVGVVFGVIVVSILAGFVEPDFGFNAGSARVLLTVFTTMVVESVLAALIIVLVMARRGLAAAPRFRFGSILIVLAAVAFTLLTGFQPGLVFGAIITVAFLSQPKPADDRDATAIELIYLFTIGVVAWIAFSAFARNGATASGDVGLLFVSEVLAALTIGALSALPILLAPVPGLPGHDLFRWSWQAWAGIYAVVAAAFALVLIPFPESWETVNTPILVWAGLYVVYALIAIAVWVSLRRQQQKSMIANPQEPYVLDELQEPRR